MTPMRLGLALLEHKYAFSEQLEGYVPRVVELAEQLDVDVPSLSLEARGVSPLPPTGGHPRLLFCAPP